MRATFRRQRHPGWRANNHEARILIAGIIQRIETARHKRVIDRANRDQPLAKQRMGQPRSPKQQEQVHLRNAQFDVLTVGGEFPFRGRGDLVFDKGIGLGSAGKQLAPVDPWSKVGGPRHIR
ncbi:hypothetical protein NIT7321_03036 [Phaeobacter italicus]|uniref:Uncharacterized protein n=1 Tax=Phaeobacter italicus TaxID=481446 RepID=A0A0H5D563_9RHOB|nr:hypothetical protein NIT7321_03036 [Phaeobacter italicus]